MSRSRLSYIDNLRWTAILLVLSMHAADTYSPLGNWYYVDRRPMSLASLIFLAAWQMYLQSFFMGLLFFLAGFFVPASLGRKGPAEFLRDRAFRLGLPVLFYMFMLGPITEYFCAHSWTSTEPTSFANEWIKHIRNGEFLQENGPLWFCLALLIFSTCYVSLFPVFSRSNTNVEDSRPPDTLKLIGFAIAMALFTFVVRLVLPSGVSFLNMHLGDFPQYILLFSGGILAARKHWLPTLSFSSGIRWLTIVLPLGFAAWLMILWKGGVLSGNGQAFSGGWHWQAASINLWESFTCVAICYGLLVIYARKFNSHGPLAKFLSDNAFSVYVFHPPILVLAARALHPLAWPAISKFILLTTIAAVVSFVFSAAVFRHIPLLRDIL
jgi:glucans biosynthesis protein C